MKKNNKTFFGEKIHTKQDNQTQLILNFELTPANVHDSQINLCKNHEVDYKDKRYFKQKYTKFNGAMTRAVRNHPLIIWETLRNQRIARKRSPVERPYAFIKRINNSHTKITTIKGNKIIVTILMILFNAEQLITLKNQKKNNIQNVCKENESETDPGITLKFFNSSIIYYKNQSLINFLIATSTNKEITKTQKDKKEIKKNKNKISMSKSDYRRNIKRKLKKLRKQKNKQIKKEYQHTIKSINEFNLINIKI